MKILIVEDEPSLRELIQRSLEKERYVVEAAGDFNSALRKIEDYDYDCILLDIMLPDGSGLDLLERLKALHKRENVIIISAKDSLEDKVLGLELGADDYLPKPFHLAELNARIKSVIRRNQHDGEIDIRQGNVRIEPDKYRVFVNNQELELNRKEYDILLYFINRPGHLVNKNTLAESVWGDHIDQVDNFDFIYAQIKNLRKKLKDAGIGTYILFQETYNKKSYEELHPTGPKHNYDYHTEAMDRAMQGGIDDVGIGVLFGLELYRYEFAGLLMHAEHLEAVHGVGPHTISVPRIKHADDIDPDSFDNGIDDETFAKICALIRISVPYTGMIISTRESKAVREKVIRLGVSQISGASCTSVGGYAEPEEEDENTAQFDVSDNRTLDEVVNWLMSLGYIPSFCTACYREGRTGDRFMSLCKSGQIQNCCHPNALMTLKEYLMDYASEDTRKIGEKLIEKELLKIPNEKVRKIAAQHIAEIENGSRDFRF